MTECFFSAARSSCMVHGQAAFVVAVQLVEVVLEQPLDYHW